MPKESARRGKTPTTIDITHLAASIGTDHFSNTASKPKPTTSLNTMLMSSLVTSSAGGAKIP